MTATLLILSVLSSAVPQPDLHAFLARRDYDSAVQYYQTRLLRNAADVQDMRNLARVYDHWHKFDSSLAWWSRVLEQTPNDDSAIVGRWYALYRRDEKESLKLAATKRLIAAEASPFLAESTARSLTLAWDGLSLSDTMLAPKAGWLLMEQFPFSPRAYEVTGNAFYDSLNAVWTNDTLKIPIIRRFLARLPKTEWRQTFYMFMLSSRFGLKDTAGLRADAAEMIADDTLDPFRYRYAAALFNRLKFDPKTAEKYAREAIRLEPTAKKPPSKPQEQWDIEYPPLYGQARLALAEALMEQGKLVEAKTWVTDAKNQFKWDNNSEWTPAPFYCLSGELESREGKTEFAILSFGGAVNWGDSRNYWTARADSDVQRLWGLTDKQLLGEYGATIELGEGFPPMFTDVTDSLGLKDRHESRVAWGDYNNDGLQDLLLNGCVLFRNDSGRRFTNVTDSAGLSKASGRGGLFADFNNDGWLDLYVAAGEGGARFYKNDSGRFVNLSDRAGGPGNDYPTEGAGWADFDNDGWVDLYCANYENWEKHIYYADQLFQNQHGYLADVTKKAGIIPPYGIDLAGRGVNWGDFNNDGYQDCYVSNYRLCENFLWVNNHDSTFTNLAGQLGVAGDEASGWYGHTIGSEWGDYDNDGDLDLFCGNLAHPRYIEFSNRSMLYENRMSQSVPRPLSLVPGPFVDVRADAGIRYEETHSDPAWADVDNDGDLDLYITSIYEGRRSFLYLNPLLPSAPSPSPLVSRPFSDVTWVSGTRVFNGWGCAFADFDNDGDQDLVVGSGSGVKLFRNETGAAPSDFNGSRRHWLEVKVVGTRANRAGIGARVTVTQGENRQMREVEGGKGTMSQNSLVQHFGLGTSGAPVTVEVKFGPKSTVVLKNVKPDQLITVEEKP
ncbi:MAG: CRTAC1 family protein [candidate division WOR-3 bacterium]|nr:CRTAC1 family protein [candidate division WOR-3 bacterium]